jgi:hypothetical protein
VKLTRDGTLKPRPPGHGEARRAEPRRV